MKPTKTGQHTTTCLKCNHTCHNSCAFANDEDKERCVAMTGGKCKICPEKCHWTLHRNVPYVYVTQTRQIMKTYEDLKKKYEEAEGKKLTAQQIFTNCVAEYYEVQIKTLILTNDAKRSLERLEDIALRPNPLTSIEYIEVLIRNEQTEGKPGWQKRVVELNNVKERAKQIKKVRYGDPVLDLINEFEKITGTKAQKRALCSVALFAGP